jgi:hypothetical protein
MPDRPIIDFVREDGWTNSLQLSSSLLKRELNDRDAAEIREYLDAVFPAPPTELDAIRGRINAIHYEVDGSPHSEGSCIEDGQDWPCATVRALAGRAGKDTSTGSQPAAGESTRPAPDDELTPAETGERENSLLYWLGPRTPEPDAPAASQ